jgi:hypothetical protein
MLHPVPTNEAVKTESQQHNCFISNAGNATPKYVCPQDKGSSPTAGLTLLWAPNPFRRNSNLWQVSQYEAGRITANNSRDEIYEKNSRIIWTDYTTNIEIAKELNVTRVLYK